MQPVILTKTEKDNLLQEKPHIQIHDEIKYAVDELFDIANPSKKDSKTNEEVSAFGHEVTSGNPDEWGVWVHYPWLNLVVHFPPKNDLRALRTSRNRNLITSDEQAKLYESSILIIGMSVGSNIVEALVSQGIGGRLILVDMDIIEPSNLNRIRSPYHHTGLHKVDAISRKVWEIDPFIEIIPFKNGLSEENIDDILSSTNIDLIVDEMDELKMKILLREKAKMLKLPVVMAADDGDDSLLDIERYDLDPETPIFNGSLPEEIINRVKNEDIPRQELGMMIGRYFVGADNIPLRMFQSLMEVGRTLPSWPQLGGAAALSGIAVAYAAKKILTGQKIRSGRQLISLDEKLDLEKLEPAHQHELNIYKQKLNGA